MFWKHAQFNCPCFGNMRNLIAHVLGDMRNLIAHVFTADFKPKRAIIIIFTFSENVTYRYRCTDVLPIQKIQIIRCNGGGIDSFSGIHCFAHRIHLRKYQWRLLEMRRCCLGCDKFITIASAALIDVDRILWIVGDGVESVQTVFVNSRMLYLVMLLPMSITSSCILFYIL